MLSAWTSSRSTSGSTNKRSSRWAASVTAAPAAASWMRIRPSRRRTTSAGSRNRRRVRSATRAAPPAQQAATPTPPERSRGGKVEVGRTDLRLRLDRHLRTTTVCDRLTSIAAVAHCPESTGSRSTARSSSRCSSSLNHTGTRARSSTPAPEAKRTVPLSTSRPPLHAAWTPVCWDRDAHTPYSASGSGWRSAWSRMRSASMWPSASRDSGTSVRPKASRPVINSGQPAWVQSRAAGDAGQLASQRLGRRRVPGVVRRPTEAAADRERGTPQSRSAPRRSVCSTKSGSSTRTQSCQPRCTEARPAARPGPSAPLSQASCGWCRQCTPSTSARGPVTSSIRSMTPDRSSSLR